MALTASQLVKEALLNHPNNLTNLSSQTWWSSQPLSVRQAAYAEIQNITGSAQGLANFVKTNGIQNVQNYSWWSTSPYKTQAWSIISPTTTTAPKTTTTTTSPTVSGATTTAPTSTQTTYQAPAPKNYNIGGFTIYPSATGWSITTQNNNGTTTYGLKVTDPSRGDQFIPFTSQADITNAQQVLKNAGFGGTEYFNTYKYQAPIVAANMPQSAPINALIKEALLNHPNELTNLQNQTWWSNFAYNGTPISAEDKKAAYEKMQFMLGNSGTTYGSTTPQQQLADFVLKNGIQNLQNYSWWSTSPVKNEAWALVQKGGTVPAGTTAPTLSGAVVGATTTPTAAAQTSQQLFDQIKAGTLVPGQDPTKNAAWVGMYQGGAATQAQKDAYAMWESFLGQNPGYVPGSTPTSPTTGTPGTVTSPVIPGATTPTPGATTPVVPAPTTPAPTIGTAVADKTLEDAIAFIRGKGLDPDVELLFTQLIRNTPAGTELNVKNMVDQFNTIKQTTINPKYQQLSDIFIDQVKRTDDARAQARLLELEAEDRDAGLRVDNAQSDLERRGMTFSGDAVKQLGADSAYSAYQFGGPLPEGQIAQQNRMISTSSAARDRVSRENLARETEIMLGTAGLEGFQNRGFTALGDQTGRPIVGTLEQDQAAFEKSTLSGLYNQESLQNEARDKITYNF